MTFEEACTKKRKWLKESRKIGKQLEKSYRKKARIKAKICLLMGINLIFLKKICFHVNKFVKKSVILVA